MVDMNQEITISLKEYEHLLTCRKDDCFYCGLNKERLINFLKNQPRKVSRATSPAPRKTLKKTSVASAEAIENAKGLRAKGLSYGKIARELGMSKGTVYQHTKHIVIEK